MARTRYASDPGLIARMGATMFLLGLVFVGFGVALGYLILYYGNRHGGGTQGSSGGLIFFAAVIGIGSALARIVDVILHDQRAIMTVGAPARDVVGVRNVTVALPRLLGGQGVLETFPLPLSDEEKTALRASAGVIRQALDELGES